MRKFAIIGERSKIGQYISKYMPDSFFQVPESEIKNNTLDVLFLSTSKEKALHFINKFQNTKTQIIDLSGSQKLNSFINAPNQHLSDYSFIYGFSEVNSPELNKNVATPGCSALGILTTIFPIKHFLEKTIFVDVKFSKSAMRFSSQNQYQMDNNSLIVYPFSHFHQNEVNYALNSQYNILVASSIIGIERGISLNIFANIITDIDLYSELKHYYKKNNVVKVTKTEVPLLSMIETPNVSIYVKQLNKSVLFNVVFDNLIFGGAYNAVNFVKND